MSCCSRVYRCVDVCACMRVLVCVCVCVCVLEVSNGCMD